jgi:hypothetical protein
VRSDIISLHLPASPCISPYLPLEAPSPHISPHHRPGARGAISAHILYLPISRQAREEQARRAAGTKAAEAAAQEAAAREAAERKAAAQAAREIQGDMGRYREIWGDMGRYGEMWGDVGRCREIWGAQGGGAGSEGG